MRIAMRIIGEQPKECLVRRGGLAVQASGEACGAFLVAVKLKLGWVCCRRRSCSADANAAGQRLVVESAGTCTASGQNFETSRVCSRQVCQMLLSNRKQQQEAAVLLSFSGRRGMQ